jgi:hypothetical protein
MTPTSQDSCGSTHFPKEVLRLGLSDGAAVRTITQPAAARSFRICKRIGHVLDRCITDAGYRGHNAPRSQVQGLYHRARSAASRRRSDANSNGRPPSSPSSATSREHHRTGRSHLADAVLAAAGPNFRRLFAWLTFLLLGILIALGLAAQLKSA